MVASLVVPLLGQVDRATLTGRVTEASGAGIPDVNVELTSKDTGLRRTVKTNASGVYQIPGLPIGKYAASFSRPNLTVLMVQVGFKALRDDVELFVGQTRTLDVQMELGVLDGQVQSEQGGGQLEHSTAELGRVIQPHQVQNIPLNGRNWASLMLLVPGSVDTGQGNQESIRFLGRSRDDNNWTLDGIDSTGVEKPRQEASLRLVISTDSIAEFRVNSALYTAESGTAQGAQINVVSKSGTNQFHGGLFEFFRNDKLDARKPLDAERPPFRLNQFGGGAGGPLAKDRSFFYANYEGLRQHLGQTLFGSVPSKAFAASAVSLSPALRPILAAYPQGLRPTADPRIDDYWVQSGQTWREDSGLLRVDHRFSVNTSGFARYNVDDASIVEPLSALLDTRTSNFRVSNLALQLQHMFSPNVSSEGRLGMNRSALHRFNLERFNEDLSVPGLTGFGSSLSCTTCTNRWVVDSPTSYSLLQNLVVIRNRHTWKAGGEIRRIHLNAGNSAAVAAAYASLDDFARNRLDNVSINEELATRGARRTYYLGFLQDEFKLRPGFTLTLGVRYEYYSVPKEIRDRARVFDFNRCQGYCPAGSPFYFPDRNNFDPRAGIAWSPAALKNKTVLHAGFGVYHGTGQNLDVIAAITSSAERFSLSVRDVPSLSLPVAPFLSIAQSLGSAPRSLQRDRRDPYSEVWSFSIGQEFPKGFVGEARYAASGGHKLFSRGFVNVIDPATGRRPLPQFGKIDEKRTTGNSSFHGLILSVRRSLAPDLLWETHYMWAHSINDNSAGSGESGQPQNTNCRQCERASSDFDIRHSFTTNFVYHLPFPGAGPAFSRKLLGNWDLSGTTTARTGRPITVTLSRSSTDLPDGNNANQRPNLVPGVPLFPPGGPTPDAWINPAAFAVPARGLWGNAGRNLLRGPALWETSLAVSKRARITERVSLHFRAEAFNFFNRSQLGNPSANLSSPSSFGRISSPLNLDATGSGAARQIQFMLRCVF